MSAPRRILLVDDHPVVLHGIRALLSTERDLAICGAARNAAEALRLAAETRPEMIIVDISIEGPDGLELTKHLRCLDPKVPILIMSMHDESIYAERALRAGASGYIMKQEVSDRIVEAIRSILDGGTYFSDRIRDRLLRNSARRRRAASPLDTLSDRELEVLRLIGKGLRTQEIAQQLHLSVKTIETYRGHLKEKLRFVTAHELLHYAVRWVEAESS